MKKYIVFLLFSLPIFSQSINDYQYVIVPIKFDFLKENDKFRLNTVTKLLLEKYGFKTYLSNEDIPYEILNNKCELLYASLSEDNGLFITKVKVVLKDCKENVVFETQFGSSREKDYVIAYNQALREAAKSFETLNYKYKENQSSTKSKEDSVKPTESKVASEIIRVSATDIPISGPTKTLANGQFYAQPIENGFQLVNTEPKVIYKIYNTSVPDFFIASKGEQQGVFFKMENSWFFEYYQFNKLYSENVGVKF